MALIEPFMVKTAFGKGADQAVELSADTGEAFKVKDIIINGSDDTYVLVEIEKTTVGFFRVDGGVLGSHLFAPFGFTGHSHTLALTGISRSDDAIGYEVGIYDFYGELIPTKIVAIDNPSQGLYRITQPIYNNTPTETLLSYMIRKGWMDGYPVAEGQTFRVKPYTSGKKLNNVIIIYEKYDAGDIRKDMPNGSEASEYVFINYGQPTDALTSSGDYEINTVKTSAEFPDFPIGDAVPSKHEIEILGILGSESLDYDGINDYTYTKYLKFFKGRKVLFDDDRNGLPFYQPLPQDVTVGTVFGEGFSVVGNYSARDRREPFLPPTPLTFKAGDELKVYITAEQATNAGEIAQGYAEIAFIERVKILE